MLQPSGYGSLRSLLLDNVAGLGSRPGRAGGGARCCGSVGAGGPRCDGRLGRGYWCGRHLCSPRCRHRCWCLRCLDRGRRIGRRGGSLRTGHPGLRHRGAESTVLPAAHSPAGFRVLVHRRDHPLPKAWRCGPGCQAAVSGPIGPLPAETVCRYVYLHAVRYVSGYVRGTTHRHAAPTPWRAWPFVAVVAVARAFAARSADSSAVPFLATAVFSGPRW